MTLVDHDHIGWKCWKLIARTISQASSLFVAQRSATYSQGNMEKFWGENVRSTPMSITSSWIESTESHLILGGGVAVCLLLSAHHAVIFALAQLFCFHNNVTTNHQRYGQTKWRTDGRHSRSRLNAKCWLNACSDCNKLNQSVPPCAR